MKDAGYDVMSCYADITDEQEVEKAVAACVERYGTIDILVNNAGIGRLNKAPQDTTLREWQKVIDINVNGSFICAKAAGKVMLEKQKGKMINMSSISGKVINKGVHGGSYRRIQAGGRRADEGALRRNGAKYNINVNAIAPGYLRMNRIRNSLLRTPGFTTSRSA